MSEVKSFKEFGIKQASTAFQGDKVKMSRILNKEIVVIDFKIENSKFGGTENFLTIQFKIGESLHIVFTSAVGLIEAIKQVPRDGFPFKTTIIEENERFEFT